MARSCHLLLFILKTELLSKKQNWNMKGVKCMDWHTSLAAVVPFLHATPVSCVIQQYSMVEQRDIFNMGEKGE